MTGRWFTALFALLLGAIAATAWYTATEAQQAVLESQSGSISAAALDPAAPGFRAFTEPTPTALVLHTSTGSGGPELTGVTFMAAGDADRGGTLVTIPATFVAPSLTDTPLTELFSGDGFGAVVDEMEAVLAIGFGEVVILDAGSWTTLMTSDLPLELALREDLVEAVDGGNQVVIPRGSRPYQLQEIARIASHRNPGEPSLGLALRQQQIWRSWISQTASAEERPELFTVNVGFVNLIGSLASGEVAYRIVPFRSLDDGDMGIQYLADRGAIDDLISLIVPFPRAAEPGDRPAVMLLDGTGGRFDEAGVLSAIVRAGGQVAILGNAASTDVETTVVQVHDGAALDTARAIAAQLGAEPPVEVPLDEATVSITIVAGADRLPEP